MFSTLKKYVPSTGKVNVATIWVALVNVILSAATIAPVELIASTWGTDIKFVPVIVTAVCVFSITEGDIEPIVGFVSAGKFVKLAPLIAGKAPVNLLAATVFIFFIFCY